jgi:hypothetical protein
MSENESTSAPAAAPRLSAPRVHPGLAAAFAASCLLSVWMGVAARRPFQVAARMAADNEKMERKILEVKLSNQRMRKEIAELETPEGKEREARRMGYLKPNEARIQFNNTPQTP